MYVIPYATTRWDEIVPNLYQGGHDYDPRYGGAGYAHAVTVADEFRLVISLYNRGRGYGPAGGVEHVVHEIPDAELDADDLEALRGLASLAAESVMDGHPTLVRCQAGYNRSGLVVGLALIQLGRTAAQAIALIRTRRSPFALCNPAFVDYLHDAATERINNAHH